MSACSGNPAFLPSQTPLSRFAGHEAEDGQEDEQDQTWSSLRPRTPAGAHETIPLPGAISENTPLLNPPIEEALNDDNRTIQVFWEELRVLTHYALPVYGLIIASVISIGHLSTTALAAISLGSITANFTAFSVIQGLTSALDTMLPSAWTSSQPQLVGLWTQRMSKTASISLSSTETD
ncbi:hypothetical protein C0993_007986 [Termitomyces sp. T159_Od127]|nr:hypothetical protein C0993_007986 [Termitomyces sp. T159_Od127]